MPANNTAIAVLSGGSAANSLVDVFESIRRTRDCPLSYIIPISDNGGSSSELIRVFGGPGIGDVRSRLVRMIPRLPKSNPGFREREAIRVLFNYRLSSSGGDDSRLGWWNIVEGTSPLWKDISSAKKELIRSILNLVNLEIIKRSRPPSSTFDFTSASVGNLFLTGARLFTGSFESAIYLLGSICGISDEVKVIPSINSNFSHHIAAGLEDGSVIVGQNAISHPSPSPLSLGADGGGRGGVVQLQAQMDLSEDHDGLEKAQGEKGASIRRESVEHYYGDEERDCDDDSDDGDVEEEDAHLPGTLPTLRTKNITFNKEAHLNDDLPARISRIWYINPYGQEILPPANPRAIAALNHAQTIIYSIGSLYTSLVPSLVLRGIGEALRRNTDSYSKGSRTKIMILNGSLDREVGPQPPSTGGGSTVFSATDFVEAIVRAGEQSRGIIWEAENQNISNGNHKAQEPEQSSSTHQQQQKSKPNSSPDTPTRPGLFSSKSETHTTTLRSPHMSPSLAHRMSHLFPTPLLASAAPTRTPSREPSPSPPPPQSRSNQTTSFSSASTTTPPYPDPIYTSYITHLIHLPNSSTTPYVNKQILLSRYGIQCVQVRAVGVDGDNNNNVESGEMRYDTESLREAIEMILG